MLAYDNNYISGDVYLRNVTIKTDSTFLPWAPKVKTDYTIKYADEYRV